ncbi:DUF3987 domain-containing protein [Vibrio amylolyticus]|uniref:DUF3987 domain-containing protein n=1 Tax=Vibrio amylolyticus TaxID=2847292 RepID=UPI00354BB456
MSFNIFKSLKNTRKDTPERSDSHPASHCSNGGSIASKSDKPMQKNSSEELVSGSNMRNNLNKEGVIKIRPRIEQAGFYGLLGHIAKKLSEGTEAHCEAILMTLMTLISISIPKYKKFVPFGANVTEHRINVLILAPTGGGKGVSDAQVDALINTAIELIPNYVSNPLYANTSSGGLSSGEGLSHHLRDSETPLNDDKRLVIVEAEFQSVLSKCNGKDSILSATIRKLFDGKSLTSMTKSDPYTCSNPHVGIVGHITQTELCKELSDSSIANGFANRFPIYCVFPKKGIPFPKVTPTECLADLGAQLNEVLLWANSSEKEMEFDDSYKELYTNVYDDLKSLGPTDSIEQKLMTRASHYATMYAMMFAIFDKTNIISSKHLTASLAWIDYWHESVQYIFNTELEALIAQENEQLADIVLTKIRELCDKSDTRTTFKTPLNHAMGKTCTGKELSHSLRILQERPKPPIKVLRGKHNKHTITLIE